MSDTLSMFFDNDFSPSIYVDKLLQSMTQPVSAYSQASLSKLSNDLSSLNTHLDYYTNELAHNLSTRLDELETNNKRMSVLDETNNSSRFQYQVQVLDNAILSLHQELEHINKSMEESDPEIIGALIRLKEVKERMEKVLEVLGLLKDQIASRVSGFDGTVSPSDFSRALDGIADAAKKDELDPQPWIDMGPIFEGLGKFGLIYADFVKRLGYQRRR